MSTNVDPHYWDRVTSSAIDKAVIPLDINIYLKKKRRARLRENKENWVKNKFKTFINKRPQSF